MYESLYRTPHPKFKFLMQMKILLILLSPSAIMYEVERGLHELRKLGIESKLWDASRRALNDDLSNHGSPTGSEA